jgi:hypothetical protein
MSSTPASAADPRRLAFADAPLEPECPGIASRAIDLAGTRWAIVEYEPDVLREEWCTEGHSGYVLAGEVTYELADGGAPLRLTAGDGFSLPDGGGGHRGRSGPDGARLFLIDRAGH